MPTANIVGTDGKTPIINNSNRWQMWSLGDIYTGQIGAGKYVPNVNDYLVDFSTFTVYIVTSIDPGTLIPTYSLKNMSNSNFTLSNADILLGVGPGVQSETYKVFLDSTVTPHTLSVDTRILIPGSAASYAKIFKGSDLTGKGQVISQVFDNAGNMLTDRLTLELAFINNSINYTVKTVPVCNCSLVLPDNEVVTVVAYNSDGSIAYKRQCLVENTTMIRSLNTSAVYVTGVSLETPFMSATTPNTISLPINIPINALNLVGVVSYSDGTSKRIPVDGTKFRVFGLDQVTASRVGQNYPFVLNYILGPNEFGFGVTSNGTLSLDGKSFNAKYTLLTTSTNNSYNVKLFGYPVWQNAALGYSMKWYLYNLDRNVFFDVTNNVTYALNTGTFDPKAYGVTQTKDVIIKLSDVSGSFKSFVYSQMVKIALISAPNGINTAWTMSNDDMSTHIPYGVGITANGHLLTVNSLDISQGITVLTDWLNKVYYSAYPLVNSIIGETVAPVPTHFQIIQGSLTTEFTINQFSNTKLSVAANPTLYDTIFVKFIKRTATGDLQLGISAMLVGAII